MSGTFLLRHSVVSVVIHHSRDAFIIYFQFYTVTQRIYRQQCDVSLSAATAIKYIKLIYTSLNCFDRYAV